MNYIKLLTALVLVSVISACGGGGESGTSSSTGNVTRNVTITTTVTAGGEIQPATLTVPAGTTSTLTVSVGEGYRIADVIGCGGTLQGNIFTVPSVQNSCNVAARFEKIKYTVQQRVTLNAKVTETDFVVEHGNSLSIALPQLTWYDLTVDSNCGGQVIEGSYVISSVRLSCVLNQSYGLTYKPNSLKPALGFERSEYPLLSGQQRDITLLTETFVGGSVNVAVEQTSGPTVPAKLKGNILELIAPTVDASTSYSFRVTLTTAEGVESQQLLTGMIYPNTETNVTVLHGDTDGLGVDLVITGDGFTGNEQAKQSQEAAKLLQTLFNEPTIAKHKAFWNIHYAPAVSVDSGAVNGSEGFSSRDTAFGSYFNCNGLDRLLCVNVSKVLTFVTERVPQYDQIMLMVNDSKYGGAGYWGSAISTFSLAPSATEIAIHEIGHSFASLADEYEYGNCVNGTEPTAVNVTAESIASNAKWNHWYKEGEVIPTNGDQVSNDTVGHFQGGRYCAFGIWRSTFNSVMRSLGMPFGSVNAEQWALSVYRDAGVVRGQYPMIGEVVMASNQGTVFSADTYADDTVQEVRWYFNDQLIDPKLTQGKTLFVPPQENDFTIKVVIRDVTGLIRKDPNQLSSKTIEWQGRVSTHGE